ncbi:MAG: biopolymer transporter ExbD [Panacibacter sp.]
MAEIQQGVTHNTKGVRRSKKLSTKVDLTPMVDLGFLLITFFVFTTSLSTPMAMKLTLPDDSKVDDPSITPAGKTISFLLAGNSKVYYYNGDSTGNLHETDYSSAGIRSVITNKKAVVQNRYGDAKETVVLIKPTISATYGNIVDALDEMQIGLVARYVLMDADESETAFMDQYR